MASEFDADALATLGWRQGAVLGPALAGVAAAHAPDGIEIVESDWLLVTSHDCDVVNRSLEKEPVVELLRASVVADTDKQSEGGRSPRSLDLSFADGTARTTLRCRVHERWTIPRNVLSNEAPARQLPHKQRRLVAEWLAKRYIRSAFPTAFDARWRSKASSWIRLLARHSERIQGVYLRLSTLRELPDDQPYRCSLIVAVPAKMRAAGGWASKREEIAGAVEEFWRRFAPAILLDEVEVLGTDELTLADIEPYQRFDADWVSFADDTAVVPAVADLPR